MNKRRSHLALLAAILLLCAISYVAPARAAPTVKLEAALVPERLGAPTTIIFAFTISTIHSQIPPPLTQIDLLYPPDLGIATSGLGLDTCTILILELVGPEDCPPNSLMGHGSALIKIPFGPEIIQETGTIATYMAPPQNGHLGLTFYAEGTNPVTAELAFPGLVLPAPPAPIRYGGSIHVNIPLIQGVSEGPDATVIHLRSTIGPLGLTYYEHRHGKTIPYHPRGIILPKHCPHNGFPFAAALRFQDHTHSTARIAVPCPSHSRRRRKAGASYAGSRPSGGN